LIESRHGVADVTGVFQRLLALLGKGVLTATQVVPVGLVELAHAIILFVLWSRKRPDLSAAPTAAGRGPAFGDFRVFVAPSFRTQLAAMIRLLALSLTAACLALAPLARAQASGASA